MVSRRAVRRATAVVALLFSIVFGAGCRAPSNNAFVELARARALTAELRVQLSQADDASNLAVMADTDEASIAFAHAAEKATQGINRDLTELGVALHRLGFAQELGAFDDFQKQWSKYRALDKQILTLAVENTNLKAQALALGPSREAADAFRAYLEKAASGVSGEQRCGVDRLVAAATLAVREIQVLQPPHIAEGSDRVMTELEQRMAGLEHQAREAVAALAKVVPKSGEPDVSAALSALDRFEAIRAQLITLSRRNSNAVSFDLALRQKPALTSASSQALESLRQALAQEGSKATR